MGEPAQGTEKWGPNPGPQMHFLASTAYEALYGGAAGGGKSEALLVDPLRCVHLPKYRAILFRRSFPELEKSLIQRSFGYYQAAFPDAKYNDQKHIWRFPSGALIYFGHLEHDKSVYDHQSAEYQYIGFDELTSFTEWQYRYMLSRARTSSGIRIRIRGATNPGGEGHAWVQRRWAPWLGPAPEEAEGYTGPRVGPGSVLYYRNTDDGEKWVPKSPEALSRVFIPAKLTDNPHTDKGYSERLSGLDPVTRAQLKDGDWLIRPAAGAYFKRAWFKFVDEAPAGLRRIRYWDFAATEEKVKGDPDWTAGLKLALSPNGEIFIESLIRFRGNPLEVESTMLATAEVDGRDVAIGLPQDPGQAGKFQASYFIGKLQGYVVHALPETGDKVTRAGPISAQAAAGNIRLVRGRWNAEFVRELEEFPEGNHDDQVDALSGAYSRLVGNTPPTYGGLSPIIGTWGGGRGR